MVDVSQFSSWKSIRTCSSFRIVGFVNLLGTSGVIHYDGGELRPLVFSGLADSARLRRAMQRCNLNERQVTFIQVWNR